MHDTKTNPNLIIRKYCFFHFICFTAGLEKLNCLFVTRLNEIFLKYFLYRYFQLIASPQKCFFFLFAILKNRITKRISLQHKHTHARNRLLSLAKKSESD